jgi:pilus assembly protein CpaE
MAGDDKIRVLIVDDIPETRENLRKLLFFESDIEVIGAAISGEEGISMAKELTPHIVLMDINMPGVDGITASEMITREVPGCQVIMMSVQGEADYLRRSMLAGAREFLIKPFSSDELISSIRRVYELGRTFYQQAAPMPATAAMPVAAVAAPAVPTGKIIAVFSPKGGAGCSTMAVNLAIALQEESKGRVGLVDASLQFGDIAVLLNMQATRTLVDLAQQADGVDSDMILTVMLPHASGIKALLGPPRPEMADLVTVSSLRDILERLKEALDYTVVDTVSSLQDMMLTVLDIADRIVLLTTPEIPAIKNAKLFFEVTDALEYPKEKTLLVLNKADRRSGIRAQDIETGIKHPVAAQVPADERIVTQAVNQGIPFVVSDKTNPVSQGIYNLARLLIRQFSEQEEEAKKREGTSRPLMGRLFG